MAIINGSEKARRVFFLYHDENESNVADNTEHLLVSKIELKIGVHCLSYIQKPCNYINSG